VYRPDGSKIADLPSVAVEPKLKLNVELKKAGDFWAAVFKPEGMKPGAKLPVILEVYGGPGHQEVIQSCRENLIPQWLANQGFIVVKLDGHGTPRRGRDWERAIKGDFATGIAADQLQGLKALGALVPEMDLSRVGVYGWSFGGYLSALLTLAHGDAIKSGVAGAPVTDWHDYDTHYTERYLGVPPQDEKAYQVSSLMTYVPQARRPLLLMHGTADDNVYFLHTLKLSDALFRAGKPHQVLPLSNFTHMVPEPEVTLRLNEKIASFFKETL
jgi:dipeptidyl-peptidase-4